MEPLFVFQNEPFLAKKVKRFDLFSLKYEKKMHETIDLNIWELF